MADLIARGEAMLDEQRHRHMTRAVEYRRGERAVSVQATAGSTSFEQADEAGLIHRVESRDFLLRAADLDLGDGPTLPQAGDLLRDAAGGIVRVYEVNAMGGGPPWAYSGRDGRVIRVHTRLIRTEPA